MALNGRIEDMNLLEILQIVAFSKKTGTLDVQGTTASGSVLFRDGMLLCAVSTSTVDQLAALSHEPADTPQALLAKQIRLALRELVALREGRFEFGLCRHLPERWAGLEASPFLRTEGIDPQQLLLELARELDEARQDTTRLLESAVDSSDESPDEPDEGAPTVVVVDDEPEVVRAVSEELRRAGLRVEGASGAAEAVGHFRRELQAGRRILLVTDAGMPTLSGESFEGGFEIVQRLADMDGTAPVLLMAESLSAESRNRARELGVAKVSFKPALSKLDPEEYESDLRSFAAGLRREVGELIQLSRRRVSAPSAEPQLNHDAIFDFLKTMTGRLSSPAGGIARMILRVAAKYAERSILFLIKGTTARGVAGLQHGVPTAQIVATAQKLAFELQQLQPFAEVVYSKQSLRVGDGGELWPELLPRGKADEIALLPLLHNHQVLAVLYCDNPNTGAPLSKLAGLQLFLVQAGMALENASLHRKLKSLEQPYSLENQGPLTEELAPIARQGS